MQSASSAGVALGEEIRASAAARVQYRPDIDGLRAISVLAVILFHGSVPGFAGGYVGVDVFFVISGYLITQVLMASSQRSFGGRLGEFYVRRCRRILPALLAMLLVTAAVACWLLLPSDLASFGTLLGATAVFANNVLAWQTGGYFDLQNTFNPLAHLWSLAVEEQFYVVFPLVLLASRKLPRQLALIAGCALASFAVCVWASYTHPRANFFLAPTRAWELLLGSLVALGLGRSLSAHPLRGGASGAALIALSGCVLGYDRSLPYPGLYALVPCASAAVLLAAGAGGARRSRVAGWLGTPALVFVGLISYSLYLWHLPILAFAAYYNVLPLEPRHLGVLLAATFVLATATWRYVEAPIRGRTVLASNTRFLAAAGIATLAIGTVGVYLWRGGGLPVRLDAGDAKLIGPTVERFRSDAVACAGRTASEVASGSLCTFGPVSDARADVLVWGDSHATVLLPAYEQIATALNVRVHAAVRSACRPLLPPASANGKPAQPACSDFNAAVVAALDKIDPALVILNAFWRYPDGALDAAGDVGPDGDARAFEAAFGATLRAIGARRKVCVIGDVPRLRYRMPYAYAMARKRGLDPVLIALPSEDADLQLRRVSAYFEELRQHGALRFVDLKTKLCAGSSCALLGADGRSLYRDDNHLSVAGAEFVRPSIESCFDVID